MFNIESGTCDWPYRVRHMRPECRHETGNAMQGLWRPASRPFMSILNAVLNGPIFKYKSKKKKTSVVPKKMKSSITDALKNFTKEVTRDQIPNPPEKDRSPESKRRKWKSVYSPANGKFKLSSMRVFSPAKYSLLRPHKSNLSESSSVKVKILGQHP
jgi:hypothetical protein